MRTMKNYGAILGALLLSACASGPRKGDDLAKMPNATYSERVDAVALTSVEAASCPKDDKWQSPNWKSLVPLANACVKAKDWRKLEAIANYLAIHADLTPWGAYYLALSAEARKDYPRTIWMLELALKKDPSEGLFHYELGRVQWDLHHDDEALQNLKTASENNQSLYQAHFLMGQMEVQKQDVSSAEDYFNKALKVNPKHLSSLLALASLKMNAKDWAKAENYLAQAIAVNPQSAKTRLALAQVQEEHLKKIQEALNSYKTLKQMASEKKLDGNVQMNLDEKIQVLQKSLAAAAKDDSAVKTAGARAPTSTPEKKVSK